MVSRNSRIISAFSAVSVARKCRTICIYTRNKPSPIYPILGRFALLCSVLFPNIIILSYKSSKGFFIYIALFLLMQKGYRAKQLFLFIYKKGSANAEFLKDFKTVRQ